MSVKAENQAPLATDDPIAYILHKYEEKNILFTKEAVEYIMNNPSKSKYLPKILENLEKEIITAEFLDKRIKQIEDDLKAKIEIIRASMHYLAKDYDAYADRIWELNTSYEAKTTVKNFLNYFRDRYRKLKNLVLQRNGIKNVVSIDRLKNSHHNMNSYNSDEKPTIIVMVREKFVYNNGAIKLIVEDETGEIEALPSDEVKKIVENVVTDEVVALKGRLTGSKKFIIEELLYPDIPLPTDDTIAKFKEPLTAAFISDLHFGSKNFLYEVQEKFFKWLKSGDDLASRLKYLFILGDNVDGIGIYPEQQKELEIGNIYDQYKAFEDFLLKIPEHIKVIVIPGNHDAVRLAEPQPELPRKYLDRAHDAENIIFETNPALLNIHVGDGYGIKTLLYHGYSFNAIIDTLTEIRKQARHNPTVVMKELLKRRHLAPIYGSTLVAPKQIDMHVIDTVPDIFASGDLHSHDVGNYKGVTLISSSTWQSQTTFQDRVGHVANPGKVTIVDLKTREFFVKDFYGKELKLNR